jgi:hypothetical protein
VVSKSIVAVMIQQWSLFILLHCPSPMNDLSVQSEAIVCFNSVHIVELTKALVQIVESVPKISSPIVASVAQQWYKFPLL